ncbi:hypothetical protein H6G06_23370 [Anabaena sphaerica FACHB-251]|uniref:Uncharacterized protein n=1 Tax=Anabaena sphaerica FACHB-251 TaxID=2692883 RepID=A0A926WKM4_9NOST|nr:hypothetical protein [Anabaena sphaerica]MBD2296341.1 hypothetical protein [Anabaena sphaerica FACHB-251]
MQLHLEFSINHDQWQNSQEAEDKAQFLSSPHSLTHDSEILSNTGTSKEG